MRPAEYYIIRFLRWFCKEEYIEEIEGDLVELHRKRYEKSPVIANWRLLWEVLCSIRLSNFKNPYLPGRITLSHYFRTSWRYIFKEGLYSVFNLTSLSLGIIFFIVFVGYYIHETTFDKFHSKSDRIYRLAFTEYLDLGSYATTSYPIAGVLPAEFPNIELVSRFLDGGRQLIRINDFKSFENVHFADEDFFRIFDFQIVSGNPNTVLDAPNKVVISQSMSQKLFGDKDPIGQEIIIGAGEEYNSVVTGVIPNVSSQSQLQFDMLISFKTFEKKYPWFETLWKQMPSNYTYVLCREQTNIHKLIESLDRIKEKYVEEIEQGDYKLTLTPLEDVHLSTDFQRELPTSGSRLTLYIFGSISLIILLIAWINYINLTSSRFIKRLNELGIRKVIGATKIDLISQLVVQSFLIVVLSTVLSVIIIYWSSPILKDLIGANFDFSSFNTYPVWISIIIIDILTLLFAGLIPIMGVSSEIVTKTLISSHKPEKSISWKKGLLIFQIVASFILITSTLIIHKQLRFIQQGIGSDNIIVVPINEVISNNFETLKAELAQYSELSSISASSSVPGYYGDSWPVRRDMESNFIQTENYAIDDQYPDVMDYELAAGRWLDFNIESDRKEGFVINEKAVSALGFTSPESAIGEDIIWGSQNPKAGVIVGVVRDFHFQSFHSEILPALMQYRPREWMAYNFLVVKTNMTDASSLRTLIQNKINLIDNSWIAELSFYGDNFQRLHLKEFNQQKLILLFSIIAVLISCIGQLGLMINTALSRQKEVAIRKIMGAKLIQNWLVITKQYLILLGISIIVSIPVSYILMNMWLENFAYKTHPGVWPFVISTFTTTFIIIIVISGISIRTALFNPVDLIRNE